MTCKICCEIHIEPFEWKVDPDELSDFSTSQNSFIVCSN